MNPEAGFIEPFKSEVARVAKAHPRLSADEIIRIACGKTPAPAPAQPTRARVETHLELSF